MIYFRQGGLFAVLLCMSASAGEPVPPPDLKEVAEFIRVRDWQRAGMALDRALAKSPEHPPALYWKSYVLFQTAQYPQASVYAQRYLVTSPASGEARKILGLAYFMQGQAAEAEQELERASALAPMDADIRYYLGRIQFERQNLPAALQSFQRTVAINPSSIRGFNHLGQTWEGLARFAEARRAYRTAIELDSRETRHSAWPYFNLGVLSLKEGHAPEAAGWLRQALTYEPAWPDATVQLAAALGAANDVEEGKRLLEELLASDPKHAQAHYQLARLLVKMQRPEEARRHFLLFAELKRP